MSQSIYIIHYVGRLEIIAPSQEEAEERAMEQLPEQARITNTEYDGEFKPDC